METWLTSLEAFWIGLQQGRLPELGAWTYLVLGVLIVLQGPLATLLGGAAAAAGLLRPVWVFVVGVGGNLIADVLWYTVGRTGKVKWLRRPSRWIGLSQEKIDQILSGMRLHSTKILLMAKLSAGFAVPALLSAGLARVPWRRWFPVVFIGETLWTGALLLIGFYATEAIKRVEQGLQYVAFAVALLLLGLVGWWLARSWEPDHESDAD
jgi:membrane protein DedA with SNARE-associated domain